MRNIRVICLLALLFLTASVSAQLGKTVREILRSDSVTTGRSASLKDSDSVRINRLETELVNVRLNEANLRMEVEQMRLQSYSKDSAKLALQRMRIDSLRNVTPGVPVVVEEDTLFYLYVKRGGYTPQQRAEMDATAITALGKRFNLHPDSLYVENSDIVSDLMYGDKVIASFTDQDGLWEGCTREQLAAKIRLVIVDKLKEMKEVHGLWRLITRIIYFVLVLLGQYLLFRLTNWLFRKLRIRIQKFKDTRLKPIKIQDYELLDTQKQVNLLIFSSNILRYVFMLILLIFTVPLLFVIFPQTKDLAFHIISYIWDPVKKIFTSVVNYLPDLFTIFVICLAVKYLIRLMRYLSKEIETGRLKINGFYPDWALPTYHIVRFLLYAFMIAMIYPYLPNADSGVFQGVSVFVGLIVSLGSSTVIGNIIAGLVITYMRPYKVSVSAMAM